MADIGAGFAGPVIEVVKWVGRPILRQFNYICCFTSIIEGLKHEAGELDLATRGLQGQVDRERDNVQLIFPEVESWLSKSNDIKGLKDTIMDEVPSVESGCLKLRARFSLSRRAKKTVDSMKELRVQKNFDPISVPQPPAATLEIPLGKTYDFESRKKIEQDIMTTLRNEDVNIIGICGMGGVGKTTMAQEIMNRVLKEHVFDEVVITTISQKVDRSNVQVEIGGSLGLNLQQDTSQVRVQKLHARLTGMKRILLVLDDVWEGLELQGLGIPCDLKGCTILVTSRNKDALSEMDVQKVFGMKVLPLKDAWFLFKERGGTCVDDARLNPIAKEVVGECGGLPIALIAVGAALKDEKDVSVWKDALRQLRRCDQDIPSFIEKVYNPLKLSYDFLRSQQAESLLLLCCLFPEDAYISLEQLAYFCMGLGIFEGMIMNSEGAKNKSRTLAKMLKSRSLLLDGFRDDVRMHDVVRDVCRIIAKQGKYIGDNDCAWISSSELIRERRSGLGFPNLRLLLLARESESEEEFNLDSAFCEGIRGLHVLWIENSLLTSLPQGTQQLKNLNTLVLDSCGELKTISVVGELVNLEILICRDCDSLEELPPGMKELNRLKLLELSLCESLQSIGRGIISSLVGLEELKMLGSFNKWEAEDREERKNAGLKELQSLTNLTCLEIEIDDPTLVAENMHISTKLERFCITFCKSDYLPQEFQRYEKNMSLSLERETCLGHWIEMQLLRETESLSLRGNGAKIVDLKKCQNLKSLKLSECATRKSIVTTCSYDDIDSIVFPASLEHIYLRCLPQLQEVSYGNLKVLTTDRNPFCVHEIPASSYQLLENLTIRGYKGSGSLLSSSIAKNLLNLKFLYVKECDEIEHVIKDDDEEVGDENTNLFPKLEVLWLIGLPKLVSFCELKCDVVLPSLREAFIKRCPKMKNWSLGCLTAPNLEEIKTDFNHHHELGVNVSFDRLKILCIIENVGNVEYPFYHHNSFASFVDGLEELELYICGSFPYSVAGKLVNLRSLKISESHEMVKVIEEEDEVVVSDEDGTTILLFPKLEMLELFDLPKLERFCERKCVVELPSLRKVSICSCPLMKSFSMGPLIAPNLEFINREHVGVGKDLNGEVQQHYLITQQKEKKEKEEAEAEAKTKKNENEKKGGEEEQKPKDDEIQDHQS